MRLLFILIALIFTLGLSAEDKQPNILLIQVDDMGYDDLSLNGNPLSRTPNLDALAHQSVRFDNFMVTSVCASTRASLLTRRDFWRTGVSGMHGGNDHLHLDEKTFGNVFQDNGYATGMWGKWHSGKSDGYWPWDRGFGEGYFAKLYNYFPSNGWFNEYPKHTVHQGKWSPEVLVDYTINFIDKNKDKPFLAYLSFLSVHDKWKTPEQYKQKYQGKGLTDRYATLLDVAGLKVPDDNLRLDGRSFKPYLTGETKSLGERSAVFTHWFPTWQEGQFAPIQAEDKAAFAFADQHMTWMNENYKLLLNPRKSVGAPKPHKSLVLIDLKKDPMERINVAKENPAIVNKIQLTMQHWFDGFHLLRINHMTGVRCRHNTFNL